MLYLTYKLNFVLFYLIVIKCLHTHGLKNYEGIFPYLEANNLACHRFAALAQARHRTGRLEAKGLICLRTVSGMSFMLPSVPAPPTHHQVPWG